MGLLIGMGNAGGGGGLSTESAELLISGQTSSFRTGDDGDEGAGRGASWLVLPGENIFGNTNRFTKTDGTANALASIEWTLDHTTDNGSTILGYVCYFWTLDSSATKSWNDAIDYCAAYSLDGFSNCRLANVREAQNLFQHGVSASGVLNYAPFSTTTIDFWHSTTLALATTTAMYSVTNAGLTSYSAKTNLKKFLPVRTFTYAELGF